MARSTYTCARAYTRTQARTCIGFAILYGQCDQYDQEKITTCFQQLKDRAVVQNGPEMVILVIELKQKPPFGGLFGHITTLQLGRLTARHLSFQVSQPIFVHPPSDA